MRISTLLANKGSAVATIRGDATVADAVDELSRHHVGALVVSSDGADDRRHRLRTRRGPHDERTRGSRRGRARLLHHVVDGLHLLP